MSPDDSTSFSRPDRYTVTAPPMANAAATTTSTCNARAPSPNPIVSSSSVGWLARMMHAMVTSGNASRKPWLMVSENELTHRKAK